LTLSVIGVRITVFLTDVARACRIKVRRTGEEAAPRVEEGGVVKYGIVYCLWE
jgi:hypothetical protein